MRADFTLSALLAALWLPLAAVCWAAPTAEQQAEVQALEALLTKAGGLFIDRKFKESGEVIEEAQSRMDKLAGDTDDATLKLLGPLHQRLAKAHQLLAAQGIKLPDLAALPEKTKPSPSKTPPAKTPKTTPTKPAVTKTTNTKKAAAATVSFVKDVVPVLNARCGNCHVRASRGQFSMATYDSLMRGPPMAGKVIFPGDAKGSVLIEKVQDKEMPPSGMGIPDAELAVLKKWIDEGAKFDGPDVLAQVVSFLPAGSQPAAPMPVAVAQATGGETVSFAKDIAPILLDNCLTCHGMDNPRNNFSLNTMTGLMKGGDRGEAVLPGRSADSLIVKKLKGTADGARMPNMRPPLDTLLIAKIEKWIDEGAKFDGPDANQPISEVTLLVRAMTANHQELSADRVKMAEENWRLGMPSTTASRAESTNFFVLGNVGESTLAETAKRAEALAPKVAETFRAPKDQALIKGRMTLFVFAERYDYGEFGKMVEKRELAAASRGHFRYSTIDAYGVVLAPRRDEYSLDSLIAQQLAAVYISAQGKGVPRWFAEGCGRVLATRVATGLDARVALWDDELAAALAAMKQPEDFLTGKLLPEQTDVCSFSFVKYLMTDSRKFTNLLDGLKKGGDFARVFSDVYGGNPSQVAKYWVRNPPSASKRAK